MNKEIARVTSRLKPDDFSNTWAYYLFFLVPSAILFRLSPPRHRPWVIVAGGSAFSFIFPTPNWAELFLRYVWEFFCGSLLPAGFTKSCFCWVRVAQAIVPLFIFKYWNFVAGLVWFRAPAQHYWAPAGAFPMEKRSAMLCT